MDFALIGAGRLGRRLALRLLESGARCTRVRRRSKTGAHLLPFSLEDVADTWEKPSSTRWPKTIFVAVQDTVLESTALQIAESGPIGGCCVLHTSGFYSSQALEACTRVGALAASWHPLQSFPTDDEFEAVWDGIPCAVEGDPEAVKLGYTMAQRLAMAPWTIQADHKAVYHAAAALAGNLPNILIDAAKALLHECGLPENPERTSLLAPLVRTCVEGALQPDAEANLTGPLARRDYEVVKRHIEVLPAELARCYEALRDHHQKSTATPCAD